MPGADADIARPRARTVYREAAALVRGHAPEVIGLAGAVLVPFALIEALGLLHVEVGGDAVFADLVVLTLTLVASGLSGLASIFYAGILDHASAAWHRGEQAPAPRAVARHLPWGQLVLASILWFVAVVGGLLLGILPGLVALTLFSLTGPVLVREQLTAAAAMRRSAQLVWHRPVLVILTAVLPFVAEVYVSDLAAELFGHHLAVELVVEVLAALFLASAVGVLEVVTTHQLIAAERR
jgi:uncharacterized membrane protein